MNKLIVFVGPNGAGKTTLMLELVRHMSDRLTVVKSLTSRKPRNQEDYLFYQFVTAEDIRKREADGKLLQIAEYAGNLYANDKADLDRLLQNKFGLISLVESSVAKFTSAGHHVVIVRVTPKHHPDAKDAARAAEDKKNGFEPLKSDCEIVNSFKPGGKEKAIRELIAFIHRTLA